MDTLAQKQVSSLVSSAVAGDIDAEGFYRGLTETITALLGCSRASLWRFTSERLDEVVCLDLYDLHTGLHSQGLRLREADYGPYFAAIRDQGLLEASHARRHPATECFNASYFEPHRIHSLLDVAINLSGKPYGLFCCEQVDRIKQWSAEDVSILKSVGLLCGMAFRKLGAH